MPSQPWPHWAVVFCAGADRELSDDFYICEFLTNKLQVSIASLTFSLHNLCNFVAIWFGTHCSISISPLLLQIELWLNETLPQIMKEGECYVSKHAWCATATGTKWYLDSKAVYFTVFACSACSVTGPPGAEQADFTAHELVQMNRELLNISWELSATTHLTWERFY